MVVRAQDVPFLLVSAATVGMGVGLARFVGVPQVGYTTRQCMFRCHCIVQRSFNNPVG